MGHSVDVLTDGRVARNVLSDADCDYDVALVDVILPGMDGDDMAEDVVLYNKKTKIILMSGLAQSAEDYPSNLFLPKPFSIDYLESLLRSLEKK
jgi:DNA-binding response OmpR family regulator